MKKFSFNSFIRKQQPKGVFIEAIQKSWHRHRSISIAIGNGIAKNIFAMRIFFLKESRIFMFFLVLSYGISTTLLQILSSLRFPIHQVKGVHWCSGKKLFEHSEASVHPTFNCSENFCILCILSSETSSVEFFLSTLVSLPGITPKSSLEQLFCRQGFIRAIQMPVIWYKKLNPSTEF